MALLAEKYKSGASLAEKYGKKKISLAEKYSGKQTLASRYGAKVQPELTPLFEAPDPYTGAMGQALTKGVSTALFGLPEFVAKKFGYKIPEPETGMERVGAGVGQLAGFVAGGPMKIGARVGTRLARPLVAKAIPYILSKQAISLGVASGLMTPEEGLFAPVERIKQFGSGAVTGTIFGGLSFIPSQPLRMATMAGIIGIPSTLREDPIEEQIFNYGLGAWFGRKGLSAKAITAQQKQIAELVNKGLEGQKVTDLMTVNKNLLGEQKRIGEAKGPLFESPEAQMDAMIKRAKVNPYRMDDKGNYVEAFRYLWRPKLQQRVWNLVKQYRTDPKTKYRMDDVSYVLDKIPNLKSILKHNDKTLEAFASLLENPPKVASISRLQPEAPKHQGRMGIYARIFRPMYANLKHMGFGDFSGKGLTNKLFRNDADMAVDSMKDRVLFNNWKMITGTKPEVSRSIAQWLDGKVSNEYLSKNFGGKTLNVAHQVRNWYDIKLGAINRQRARYGMDVIKPRKDYYTHIYDTVITELQNPTKYNLPADLRESMQFITPKEKWNPYLQKRKGGKEFTYDIWKALDIYSHRANWSANDDFIRDANRYVSFVKSARKNKTIPVETQYALDNVSQNLDKFIKEYTGRHGELDKNFRATMDNFNKIIVNAGFPEGSIKTVSEMSNFLTSAIYGTQMGFRPKLALRNLGQHSLIIGQTGFKPLGWALTAKRNPELLDILSKSQVVRSRAMAFAPEIGRVGKFVKSGMWMFQKADLKNVTDAYLSGYRQAKLQGKSTADAVRRGDQVAGLTQFLYLRGNRSGLARGLGLSGALGRPASIFTTWPTNYMEFIIASSAPEHRANLLKYLATGVGITSLSAVLGVKGKEYVGIASPWSLFRMFKGELPIAGVAQRPKIQVAEDIKKLMKGDIGSALFYTFKDTDDLKPWQIYGGGY